MSEDGSLPYPRTTGLAMKLIRRATDEQVQSVYAECRLRELPVQEVRSRLEALARVDPARVLEWLAQDVDLV